MVIPYIRILVKAYARRWWRRRNPDYISFENDCTSFISQCVRAGRAPMTGAGDRGAGWWYRGMDGDEEGWSYSWAVANAFRAYLRSSATLTYGLKATQVDAASDLTVGDVICYDWSGDGIWEHTTVVVGKNRRGSPLVAAHTKDSYMRFWRYRTSRRYTPNTQYEFYHIADQFEMPSEG